MPSPGADGLGELPHPELDALGEEVRARLLAESQAQLRASCQDFAAALNESLHQSRRACTINEASRHVMTC